MSLFEGGVAYDGTLPEGVTIAFGTDVWLHGGGGTPVDLQQVAKYLPETLTATTECETCTGGFIDGVFAPVNSEYGVEACGSCAVYEGDLEAAQALAAHFEKAVYAKPGTIQPWYIPSTHEEE